MSKTESSTIFPGGSSKRKRSNVAQQEMTKRYRHIVPGYTKFAGSEVIREAMPDLERMGLSGLVKHPWKIQSTLACHEYIDFVKKAQTFPLNHRVHRVKFDKELFTSLYHLPSTGEPVCSGQTWICKGMPSKFFRGPMPPNGWYHDDVIDPRLQKVIMVLNPILNPERHRQIKKTTAWAICMAWIGEKIDWAGHLFEIFRRLAGTLAARKTCFLSPFLLHAYNKSGLLSSGETHQFFKAERNLNAEKLATNKSDPLARAETRAGAEVGEVVRRTLPGAGKIVQRTCPGVGKMVRRTCPGVGKRVQRTWPGVSKTVLRRMSIEAQDHDIIVLSDESDVEARSGAEVEEVTTDEEMIEVEVRDGISEHLRLRMGKELISDVFVQPQVDMQSGAVTNGKDAERTNSEGLRLLSNMPSSNGVEQMLEDTSQRWESHGEDSPCLLASESISKFKLLMSAIAEWETSNDVIFENLGCTVDDVLHRCDATRRDQAKLRADSHHAKKQSEDSHRIEKLLQDLHILTLQFRNVQKQNKEAEGALEAAVNQLGHWKKHCETVNSLLEDKKKSLTISLEVNTSLATEADNLQRKLEATREKNSVAEEEFPEPLAANLQRKLEATRGKNSVDDEEFPKRLAANLQRKLEAMCEKNSVAEEEFPTPLAVKYHLRLEKELAHSNEVEDDAL